MSISSRKVGSSYRGIQKKKRFSFFRLVFFVLLATLGYYSFDFYQKESKAGRDHIKSFNKLLKKQAIYFKSSDFQKVKKDLESFYQSKKNSLLSNDSNEKVFVPKTKEKANQDLWLTKPKTKNESILISEKKQKKKKALLPKAKKKIGEVKKIKNKKILVVQKNKFQPEQSYLITDYQNPVKAFNFALEQIKQRGFSPKEIILKDYQYTGTTVIRSSDQTGNSLFVSYRENFSNTEQKKQTFWKFTSYSH